MGEIVGGIAVIGCIEEKNERYQDNKLANLTHLQ